MPHGFARSTNGSPLAKPQIPEGAVVGDMPTAAPRDTGPLVSKVGPLWQFLPAIYGQMTTMAACMGLVQELLAGNFEVLDAETTGFSPSKCVMWQLSAMRFENFEPVESLDRVISISREDYEQAFDGCSTDRRRELMDMIHLSWERIEEEGQPAEKVLLDFEKFLGGTKDSVPLLGYHTRSIDLPFIQVLWAQHFNRDVFLPMRRLIDVGVAIKAAQIGRTMITDESPDMFMRRVTAVAAKAIYWSVKYVTEQFHLNLDSDELHDALTDCKVLGMIWDVIAHQGMTDERKQQWHDRPLGKIQSVK